MNGPRCPHKSVMLPDSPRRALAGHPARPWEPKIIEKIESVGSFFANSTTWTKIARKGPVMAQEGIKRAPKQPDAARRGPQASPKMVGGIPREPHEGPKIVPERY